MAIVLTEEIKREIGQVCTLLLVVRRPLHTAHSLQHFVFGFHGQEVSDDIKKLITEYYVGCARVLSHYDTVDLTFHLKKRDINETQRSRCAYMLCKLIQD